MSTYQELLLSPDWKSKRAEILIRDENRCTRCFSSSSLRIDGSHYYFDTSNLNMNSWIAAMKFMDYKELHHINNVEIYGYITVGHYEKYLIGLSNNGILFGCSQSILQPNVEKETIFVHLFSDVKSHLVPYISISSKQPPIETILLPNKHAKVIIMHVHHNLYIRGHNPWEYDNSDLITLCNWCHWDVHQREVIPIYDTKQNGQLVKLVYHPCKRCNGAGVFPEYDHVENGICFRCRGYKYEELI